jgi:hypothetical protein
MGGLALNRHLVRHDVVGHLQELELDLDPHAPEDLRHLRLLLPVVRNDPRHAPSAAPPAKIVGALKTPFQRVFRRSFRETI